MEWGIWLAAILLLTGFIVAVWGVERLITLGYERARSDRSEEAPRRAVSGAAFAFQQFYEPTIEHAAHAQQDEPGERDDISGDGDSEQPTEELLTRLLDSLATDPVDIEDLRQVLDLAHHQGHEWSSLYNAALEIELSVRPYRAPFLPPPSRVAPRV